ncbi:MAG TPA: putative Fe-S cluster assembly protein SufT, partial [Nevskia sp.]|nr:putative Fe-S cluster assembly protein SufT [Nevskia sp.]
VIEGGGWRVRVVMTLTAPGSGMGDVLVSDVKGKVIQIPGVREADVELSFDPPWTREMMSEAAQLQAGFM